MALAGGWEVLHPQGAGRRPLPGGERLFFPGINDERRETSQPVPSPLPTSPLHPGGAALGWPTPEGNRAARLQGILVTPQGPNHPHSPACCPAKYEPQAMTCLPRPTLRPQRPGRHRSLTVYQALQPNTSKPPLSHHLCILLRGASEQHTPPECLPLGLPHGPLLQRPSGPRPCLVSLPKSLQTSFGLCGLEGHLTTRSPALGSPTQTCLPE